jgi:hypothetical protein
VRTARYGYAGVFDAVKVKADDLARIYQFDLELLHLEEPVQRAIENVEVSIGTDGLPAALQNLITTAQECIDTFNKRSEALKGIAAS